MTTIPRIRATSMGTTSRPRGHREIGISLTLATANGMPTTVRQRRKAVTTWAMASSQPRRMSQINVADERAHPRGRLRDGGPAEGPDDEAGDAERGGTEGDGEDQDAGQDAGHDVGEPQPDPREDEPDDVAKEPHGDIVALRTGFVRTREVRGPERLTVRRAPEEHRGPCARSSALTPHPHRRSTARVCESARSSMSRVSRGSTWPPADWPARPSRSRPAGAALTNCRAVLRAGGVTFDHVVEVGVLLADPDDFAGMNEEYAQCCPADPPCRYAAQLGAVITGVRVSIRMTAIVESSPAGPVTT